MVACRLFLALGMIMWGGVHAHAVSPGDISTVAGNSTYGYSGDDVAAPLTSLYNPSGITVDSTGNLYIADMLNNRIRKVAVGTGIITTIAGTGTMGYSGNDGLAISAKLSWPTGVSVDSVGNLYIADSGNDQIRKISVGTGIITSVAGTGSAGFSGDNGLATLASLNFSIIGVAIDSAGNLFIADTENNRIRKVAASTGIITTVAGTDSAGFSGDNGLATLSSLSRPMGVAVDSAGNLFIADFGNNRIRKVAASTGIITTVAGTGTASFTGDGGNATSASLASPMGVSVDSAGNLFIADFGNNRIRRVSSSGIITTVAGTGTATFAGDGGAATLASLYSPRGLTIDSAGNLYIADTANQRIRKVTSITASAMAITIASQPFNYSNQASGTIAFSANKTATFECTLDSGSYATCTSPYSYSSLTNGRHTFSVRATDSAGNVSTPVSFTWSINTDLAVSSSAIPLPQTGQTTCYDASYAPTSCIGTGQDGEMRIGAAWSNTRFMDNSIANGSDKTVSDNLTGLIWAKDANLMMTRDSSFDIDGTADGMVTWQHALDYVKKLNTENYMGHNDWRLPNYNELTSLVNNGQGNTDTWLNSRGFSNVQANKYWSSTTYPYGKTFVWYVNMSDGSVNEFGSKTSDAGYVWFVRGGQSGMLSSLIIPQTGQTTCYDTSGATISCTGTGQDGELQAGAAWPTSRFTPNANQTVSDNLTGLVWSKDANSAAVGMSWQQALEYIKTLNSSNYLGHNDWRLPNRSELESLLNKGQITTLTWLTSQGFSNVRTNPYWSSSTYANDPSKAWYVNLYERYGMAYAKTSTFYVWPVRGGQVDILAQNFDSVTPPGLPSGWSSSGTGNAAWFTKLGTNHPSTSVLNPSNLVYFNSYTTPSGNTASLISPVFSLANTINGKVSFWMYRDIEFASPTDRVIVSINTIPSDIGASLLGTVNRSMVLSPVVASPGWYRYEFDIPSTYSGATNYLIIKGVSGYGNDIHLDDIAVNAARAALLYTVSFSSNGGSAVTSQSVAYNSPATQPAIPTKAGYNFSGWCSDIALNTPFSFATTIISNTSLYAKWTTSITYLGNDNTSGTVPTDTNAYLEGSLAVLLGNPGTLAKTGYTFTGWNTLANGSGTNYASDALIIITTNTTLYAKWTALPTYTVTYNGNTSTSGSAPADVSSPYISGTTVTVLNNTGTLAKTGYTFNGWNTLANGSGTAYSAGATFPITANATLYAKWTPNNYTVSFSTTGVGGNISCITPASYGSTSTCTISPATGYVLATLTDNSVDVKGQVSGTVYSIANVAANHTMTATFTDIAAPTITSLTVPAASTTTTVAINTFTATDNVSVTGYCVTETSAAANCIWYMAQPTSHTFGGSGVKTLYAFAKDSAGNISAPASATTTITSTVTRNITTSSTAGGIALPANQTVTEGNTATLTIVPAPGYYVTTATGCGGTLSGTTYTSGAVTADCTIDVAFAKADIIFNEQAYLAANPDIADALNKGLYGITSGWDHYNRGGKTEGRQLAPANYGNFNENAYLLANPDVAAAVKAGQFSSGWEHYAKWGKAGGLPLAPAEYGTFNEQSYLAVNPDIADALNKGLYNITSGWDHYSRGGKTEGRALSPVGYGCFNESAYLLANPDVAAAVKTGQFSSGWAHYAKWGKAGGLPLYPAGYVTYREEAYLAANPDVAAAVKAGQFSSGWEHYAKWGKAGGLPTEPPGYANFSETAYLAANPDVAYALRNGLYGISSGWNHYSGGGIYEGRTLNPPDYGSFNEGDYLAANPDVFQAVVQSLYGISSGWDHYTRGGMVEGRKIRP